MKKARLRQSARDELAHASTWYRERDSSIAEEFLAEVRRTLTLLERFPRAGTVPNTICGGVEQLPRLERRARIGDLDVVAELNFARVRTEHLIGKKELIPGIQLGAGLPGEKAVPRAGLDDRKLRRALRLSFEEIGHRVDGIALEWLIGVELELHDLVSAAWVIAEFKLGTGEFPVGNALWCTPELVVLGENPQPALVNIAPRLSGSDMGVDCRREFVGRSSTSHNLTMTGIGRHIVDDFEALPDSEKREVLSNLLRISGTIDYPAVSDEELLSAADGVFLQYDRLETNE